MLTLAITLVLVAGCSKKSANNQSMQEDLNDLQPIQVKLMLVRAI